MHGRNFHKSMGSRQNALTTTRRAGIKKSTPKRNQATANVQWCDACVCQDCTRGRIVGIAARSVARILLSSHNEWDQVRRLRYHEGLNDAANLC